MSGADTRAAVSVPAWLTASSPPAASSSDFASIHSRLTRSESLAIAVRQGRDARALAVRQGAGSTAIRVATSGGGRLASWSNATSRSVSPRSRYGLRRRATFQETIFTVARRMCPSRARRGPRTGAKPSVGDSSGSEVPSCQVE